MKRNLTVEGFGLLKVLGSIEGSSSAVVTFSPICFNFSVEIPLLLLVTTMTGAIPESVVSPAPKPEAPAAAGSWPPMEVWSTELVWDRWSESCSE